MDFKNDPGLLLYLPLYELYGASLMSRDAYGHLCTVTGALWRPDGRYFDGLDDIITCGDLESFPTYFEVSAWIKGTAENYRNAWCTEVTVTAGDNALRVQFSGTNLLLYVGGVSWTIDSLSSDVWYYVVVQTDTTKNKAYAYLDNVLKVDEAHSDWPTTIPDFTIGRGYNTDAARHWKGTVGEVAGRNRLSTPLEIQRIYLATKWRYR